MRIKCGQYMVFIWPSEPAAIWISSISVNVLSMDDAVPRTHIVEIVATGVTVFESGSNAETVEIAVTAFTAPPTPTYTGQHAMVDLAPSWRYRMISQTYMRPQ